MLETDDVIDHNATAVRLRYLVAGLELRLSPLGDPIDGFRELLTAFATVVGVVVLSARLASQRTEVRRADARARLLAAAVEQTDSLVMVVRQDGTIEHANAAMLRALGETRESFPARGFSDTVAAAVPGFGDLVEAAVRKDGIWRGTFNRRASSCSISAR